MCDNSVMQMKYPVYEFVCDRRDGFIYMSVYQDRQTHVHTSLQGKKKISSKIPGRNDVTEEHNSIISDRFSREPNGQIPYYDLTE